MATFPNNTVFLSYRRQSAGGHTKALASILGDKLYNPDAAFYDKRAIRYGSKWWPDIVSAIDECRFFVPVITPKFPLDRLLKQDDVLRQEYLCAGARGDAVTIVPALIDGASPPALSSFDADPELQQVIARFHTDNGVILGDDSDYWGSELQRLCAEIANSFANPMLPGIPSIPPTVEMFGCRINRLDQVAAVSALAPRDLGDTSQPQLFVIRGGQDCGRWQFGSDCLHRLAQDNQFRRPHIIEHSSFSNQRWSDEVRHKAIVQQIWQKLGRSTEAATASIELVRNELVACAQPQLFILNVSNKKGLRSINFNQITQFFEVWQRIWHADLNRLLTVVVFIGPHRRDWLALKDFNSYVEACVDDEVMVLNSLEEIDRDHLEHWCNLRAEHGFHAEARKMLQFLDMPGCLSRLLCDGREADYDEVFRQFKSEYRRSLSD